MAEICYLTYAFFFVSSKVDLLSYILPSIAANFVVILSYITAQCSAIVNTSARVHRQTMKMAVRRVAANAVLQEKNQKFKNFSRLWKIDLMAASDEDEETFSAFKLATGHLINSSMFQSVAMYTLMFFMIVFKNNENIQ